MARIRVPLNNFQFGEVSPALHQGLILKYIQMQQNKSETFLLDQKVD